MNKITSALLVVSATIGCLITPNLMIAQNNLDTIRQVVTKDFIPVVKEAQKIRFTPENNDTSTISKNLTYLIKPTPLSFQFTPDTIKSAKLVGEPLTKLYRFHAQAGFGTQTTTYGDVTFNNLRSKENQYGIHLHHIASSRTIANNGYSGISRQGAEGYYKLFLQKHSLTTSMHVERDNVYFYGFDSRQFTDISKDSIRQRFQYYNPQLLLKSHYADSTKLNHQVKVNYHHQNDRFNATENNVLADVYVWGYVNKERFSLRTSGEYANNQTLRDTQIAWIGNIAPAFESITPRYQAKIGITATIANQTTTKFYFYPNCYFSYRVAGDIMIPFAGLTGNITRNTMRGFMLENPFITSSLNFQNTNRPYEVYGGLKGALTKQLSYTAKASYSKVVNLPLFVSEQNNTPYKRFEVVYDTAKVFQLSGQIEFVRFEKIRLLLSGNYYNYQLSNQPTAWYRPSFDLTASFRYNLQQKIMLQTDIYVWGKRNYLNQVNQGNIWASNKAQLPEITDASLLVEYRYNKRMGAFVRFNNLRASAYQRWEGYPSYKLQALLGLSYSF